MAVNLLRKTWENLDSHELRLLLNERIGGRGQYNGRPGIPNRLYLPLADASCRIVLTFRDKRIVTVEPGPAFDPTQWQKVSEEIETSLLSGPLKVGLDCSFSSFRVSGSWRGDRSGVQILPPPAEVPRAPYELAEHPFIIEFPMKASALWSVNNHRRQRQHRNLTLLLNILLAGRTSLQPRRSDHFWAIVPCDDGDPEIKWVQQGYFAKFGEAMLDDLSPPAAERLVEVEPDEYYEKVGNDGKGLRVPTDLDQSICLYLQLSSTDRTKFDRATFWMDMASRQWTASASSSFASLVSAIESLAVRGAVHQVYCEQCKTNSQHDMPGATERFRAFFEKYVPGAALRKRRTEMYKLRSDVLHGSDLMQLDQALDFGWDSPWWNELELHRELWGVTRAAIRNWLRNPATG